MTISVLCTSTSGRISNLQQRAYIRIEFSEIYSTLKEVCDDNVVDRGTASR